MRDNFQASLLFVLRHECVYAPGHEDDLDFVICENVPGDPGGCTKYGIDAADHPGVDIPGLTLDQAMEMYRDAEWTQCQCDALPQGIDTAVFDTAVNNGVHTAGILLQRALNACGGTLEVDGEIGPVTIAAANQICDASKWGVLGNLLEFRRQHYADIVLLHPAEGEFLQGWLNRVNDLEQSLEEAGSATA
jgi:lysozyme family protein